MTNTGQDESPALLYVDDSHGNLDAFEQIVGHQIPEAQVFLAATAAEGLLIATQRDIDVILVDLGLRAESDGLMLIRELKSEKRTSHIPILLVIPAGARSELVEEAFELGVQDTVRQLLNPLEVRTRIATMHRMKRSEDRLRQAGLDEDEVLEAVLSAGGAAFISMVDKSADGFVVVGLDQGVKFVSKAAAELLGKSRQSMVGKPFDVQITGNQTVDIDLQPSGSSARKGEMRAVETEWEGEPAWVVSLRDVTEQWCMDDQLQQAQKMEAIAGLAGSVGHDFKNIFHGILGYTELLSLKISKDTEEFEYLCEIEDAAERGGALTQQLHAFSRTQSLASIDIDINAFIDERFEALIEAVGDTLSLELHQTPDLPLVDADPNQLERTLIELCKNARDASPEGGTISLTTGLIRFSEIDLEEYSWASTGRYVTISVDDSGQGIDLQTQSRIFEPFFTTKDSHTGLGLAMVYGIVTQHQGNIEVTSHEGEGTDVTLYLPTTEKDSRRATIPPPNAFPRDARTILLAEDDDVVRFLTERILQRAGCEVYSASNGVDAFDIFEAHMNEIAMAVLDVAMPHMSGDELYVKLKESRPDLPVLFVTAHGEAAVNQRFGLENKVEVLEKPFRPPALLRKIRVLLDRRNHQKE